MEKHWNVLKEQVTDISVQGIQKYWKVLKE
jgi:hypothetical protein